MYVIPNTGFVLHKSDITATSVKILYHTKQSGFPVDGNCLMLNTNESFMSILKAHL